MYTAHSCSPGQLECPWWLSRSRHGTYTPVHHHCLLRAAHSGLVQWTQALYGRRRKGKEENPSGTHKVASADESARGSATGRPATVPSPLQKFEKSGASCPPNRPSETESARRRLPPRCTDRFAGEHSNRGHLSKPAERSHRLAKGRIERRRKERCCVPRIAQSDVGRQSNSGRPITTSIPRLQYNPPPCSLSLLCDLVV